MGQAAPRGTRFALDRRPEGWFMRIPLSRFLHLVLAATLALAPVAPAGAAPRIKDISDFEGMRDNMLVGYGLVVGLNGSGDSLRNAPFTRQSLIAMLERLGVNTRDATLNTQNVAAVMVTANLPPPSPARARVSTSPFLPSATRAACWAAPSSSPRCSARTARSTPWPRAR